METTNYAWSALTTVLAILMVPAVGLVHFGTLPHQTSAASLRFVPLMTAIVTYIPWYSVGYSLVFSPTGSRFIGDLHNAFLRDVFEGTFPENNAGTLDTFSFVLRQSVSALTCTGILTGATAQRGRTVPCLAIMLIWIIVVYSPIAHWTWNMNGWIYKMGVIDFAGGIPIHTSAGFAALAYSYILGARPTWCAPNASQLKSNILIGLGTVCFWLGSLGLLSSPLAFTIRSGVVINNTNLAASTGGIAWSAIDLFYFGEEDGLFESFCSGVFTGLIAITSGAGVVPSWAAIIYGISSGCICNISTRLKFIVRCDDALDIFAIHGIGGIVGTTLTALFATNAVICLDQSTAGYPHGAGWMDRHWSQLSYHIAASIVSALYSFFVTLLIVYVIEFVGLKVYGLRLRIFDDETGDMNEASWQSRSQFRSTDCLDNSQVELFEMIPGIASATSHTQCVVGYVGTQAGRGATRSMRF